MAQGEAHRASGLKQHNKKHNKLGHKSKGQIKSLSQGRLSVQSISRKAKHELSRQERRNQVKVVRATKKEKSLMKKRSLGTALQPPFLVCVVLLSPELNSKQVITSLTEADPDALITYSDENNVHLSSTKFKQRFSFVIPKCHDMFSILDTAKVCSTLLLVWPCFRENSTVRPDARQLLSAIKAQGLPTPVHTTLGYHDMAHKRKIRSEHVLLKEVAEHFPGDKVRVHHLDKPGDPLICLRTIGSQKQRDLYFRDHRPHMIAEKIQFTPNSDGGSSGRLSVSGYVRGVTLSADRLVHIPGWGDFQVSSITEHSSDPFPIPLPTRKGASLINYPDTVTTPTEEQESLATTKDDMGEESDCEDSGKESDEGDNDDDDDDMDDDDDDDMLSTTRSIKSITAVPVKKDKLPGGFGAKCSYQAAWMIDNEAFKADFGGLSDSEEEEDEFMPPEAADDDTDSVAATPDDDSMSVVSSSEYGDDDAYDEKVDYDREMDEYQRFHDARDDLDYPDEVDTPREISARERFLKYRGLASFRASPWDLNENLPEEYSKIFHIPRYDHVRKRMISYASEETTGAMVGSYVTIDIENVPSYMYNEQRETKTPLVVFGILPHEAKMSLINFVLKWHPGANERPIQSKDRLIFHVGFRRYINQPIFSSHTSGQKQKFSKFFHVGHTVVASMYAPVTYAPASVVVFRQISGNRQQLVATGSVYSVNTDRCILKRVVLTGHPFKIHKRSVVIRHMFFNPDDISWFKPIELKTKFGRRGKITEALGTHGHMKCMFDGHLKSNDIVLLQLYKRVFPKWTYNSFVPKPEAMYSKGSFDTKEDSDGEDEALSSREPQKTDKQIEEEIDSMLMPPPGKKPKKVHFS